MHVYGKTAQTIENETVECTCKYRQLIIQCLDLCCHSCAQEEILAAPDVGHALSSAVSQLWHRMRCVALRPHRAGMVVTGALDDWRDRRADLGNLVHAV